MLKNLGKRITTVNTVVFIFVFLVGGISIILTLNILHNLNKIKEVSEHITIVDKIHADSFQFLLDIHHFLIEQDELFADSAINQLLKVEKQVEGYIIMEEAERYKERHREIELLEDIKKNIVGQKKIIKIFDNFKKKGTFDREEFIGLEEFGYTIESNVAEINRIHFTKINEWEENSLSNMWIIFFLYVIFLTAGGLSVFFGHRFLSIKVVKPIKELSSATIEFSEGTLDKRVTTNSKTEIGLLYKSFNEMAEKIQQDNELLIKFNEELENMVKERTLALQQANEQLKRTQDALIRTGKIAAIGQIATGVTHEIKTPLNALAINAQMLQSEIKEKFQDEENGLNEMAHLIQCEVKRINNILDNFVSFAKFPEPKFMQNNINRIIKEVVTFISIEAKDAGVTIDLSLSDNVPEFGFDRPQVKEVLMNLVKNAIHAMVEGGVLKINTSLKDKNVIVTVSDEGIGIPEKNFSKIFSPFFSTKDGGMGLGLATVQKIIEAHGGKIRFRSTVGKGTVFEIVLPIERD